MNAVNRPPIVFPNNMPIQLVQLEKYLQKQNLFRF